jgi:hypothetical protein
VMVNGLWRDKELFGNVHVGQTFRDEFENFSLSRCETRRMGSRLLPRPSWDSLNAHQTKARP